MLIKNARFLKSMKGKADYPDTGLPEIAICGKSNVGKSSLVNYLTGNYKLAKISSTPGKTRLVNFFVINEAFMLVDLPGYGFAKVAKTEKLSWAQMVETYLKTTKRLRALLILLDIRHKPTADDKLMFDWAALFGLSVIIIATKADKIAKTKRIDLLKSISQEIGRVEYPIVAVSSQKRIGAEALLDEIEKAIEA
jgi:GTP-binding protein